MYKFLLPVMLLVASCCMAQRKPLDHAVYDDWKSVGERLISNDGTYVVYTVQPQEGDGELVIQNPATRYKRIVSRGYGAVITEDSRHVIFKIKPWFKETRQARIKKKKADELPKDSIGIIELGKEDVLKKGRIKAFKVPERGAGFVAMHFDKPLPDTMRVKPLPDSVQLQHDVLAKAVDSLIRRSIDSVKGNIRREALLKIAQKAANSIIKAGSADAVNDAEGEDAGAGSSSEGTDLVLRNLGNGWEKTFRQVTEFQFDKWGTRLLIETARKAKDSASKSMLLLYHLQSMQTDTLLVGFNDARNFVFDESGSQLGFVAERDSSEKALQKFYQLYYYQQGQDTAIRIADRTTVGMQVGFTVSEHAKLQFSNDGSKLYFGTAPVRAPRDTSLVEFETARLDVWHYKDDYLQTQQLKNLDIDLKKSYTAVYHLEDRQLVQLGGDSLENITLVNEGNADWVLAETNYGNRVEFQWTGRTNATAFMVNVNTGGQKLIYRNLPVQAGVSPAGKFVYWYNPLQKQYFTYEVATGLTRAISGKVTVPLYDIENDVPDYPDAYGVMGWQQGDSAVYIYDQFGYWRLSPLNDEAVTKWYQFAAPATKSQYTQKLVYRYVKTDREERFLQHGQLLTFSVFNKDTKENSMALHRHDINCTKLAGIAAAGMNIGRIVKAKFDASYAFTKESYRQSPDMYYSSFQAGDAPKEFAVENLRLSNINPQQAAYNWGTARLYQWKNYKGKPSTGIVYTPEDYVPGKKYPLICYFYEKLSDGLHTYIPPAPTASRLNISFFVSRGYIVLAPDIVYETGHPGADAYNIVASGARALVQQGLVDSTRIGIQGQSWGGYQVAYLITATKLFRAAWAGAPVANMTSAYGGIRWESGINRQFQYERQQSRIGASLWDNPGLYIENSPLFHLPKVQTPLVIMHNDADGAVPWYQGIELFTGLRRLGKPVWMLNYNGEAHNLLERKNRKDIQVREQQFFDWLLKGEPPARWLKYGIPATDKGKDWGLELE